MQAKHLCNLLSADMGNINSESPYASSVGTRNSSLQCTNISTICPTRQLHRSGNSVTERSQPVYKPFTVVTESCIKDDHRSKVLSREF